ncbi:MAG: response regulator transcription factor [Gammaproteobacteria bacterium]
MKEVRSGAVAVIDDDADVREVLEAYLTIAGYTVHTYESGRKFLETAALDQFDCLLVDQRMPDMTGLEMVEELDSRGIRIPALLITGECDETLTQAIECSGMAGILQKPMSPRELLTFLEGAR